MSAVPPKTSPGAKNMKTGPDALGTAENEFGRAKHENGTRLPRYRRKRVGDRKTRKTGPDALGTAEKTSMAAQYMKMGPDAPRTAENVSWRAK
jgi:hypothetical protein